MSCFLAAGGGARLEVGARVVVDVVVLAVVVAMRRGVVTRGVEVLSGANGRDLIGGGGGGGAGGFAV